MSDDPPRPDLKEGDEMRRRRRGVNLAILLALIALCALFYAITIVKMTKS